MRIVRGEGLTVSSVAFGNGDIVTGLNEMNLRKYNLLIR